MTHSACRGKSKALEKENYSSRKKGAKKENPNKVVAGKDKNKASNTSETNTHKQSQTGGKKKSLKFRAVIKTVPQNKV